MVTRNDFMAYEEARQSGEYNMITDAHSVMFDYAIHPDIYWEIVKNYSMYHEKYMG